MRSDLRAASGRAHWLWCQPGRLVSLCLLLLLAGGARAGGVYESSLFRLEVEGGESGMNMGSAVLVAPGVLLTNCHVVRDAQRIRVYSHFGETWRATLQAGDAYRDVCVLRADAVRGTVVKLASAPAMTGHRVTAVGYSDGRFRISEGEIRGLHSCPCEGGRIIQTTAPFDPGASGGGLFNQAGELVGMLTFKNRLGGAYHFAVPISWYRDADLTTLPDRSLPFWKGERHGDYFLAACALGAEHDWKALRELAQRWQQDEPSNPEPWVALGRAEAGQGARAAARQAFEAALQRDPSHADARRELDKLESAHAPQP